MSEQNNGKTGNGYISLREAAKYSGRYSQEYLSLRARQGKLKAVKFGRNWVTRKEWVDEYIKQVNDYKNKYKNNCHQTQVLDKKEAISTISSSTFTFQPVPRAKLFAIVVALVFIFASIGLVFGYPYYGPALKEIGGDIVKGLDEGGRWMKGVGKNLVKGVNEGVEEMGTVFTEASASIREFTSALGEGIVEIGEDISERVSNFGEKIVIKVARSRQFVARGVREGAKELGSKTLLGFKNFGANISAGAGLIAEEVNEGLAQPIKNFTKGTKNDFIRYITQDIRAIKKFAKEIPRTTLEIFKKVPQKIASIFKKEKIVHVPILTEEEIEELITERAIAEEELKELQETVEKLKEEGIPAKEIVKEVTRITQVQPVIETTKRVKVIDSKSLVDLTTRLTKVEEWETDIQTLRILTTKLQTHEPSTQVLTAPVYIGSSGLQVGGAGTFSSLAVSGSLGVKDLGVGDSTSLGSDASDQLTVNATADFISPVTITNTLTITDTLTGATTTLTTLTTTGDVTVGGDFTVSGAQTYSGAAAFTASSTAAALLVNQTGTGNIVTFQDSSTTVFQIADGGAATLTSTSTPQLTIRYDASNYLTTAVSSAGDTTLTSTGALNLTGNATSTWQIVSAPLTIQTATTGDIVLASAGNLTQRFATTSAFTLYQGPTARLAIDTSGNISLTATSTISLTGDTTITGSATTTAAFVVQGTSTLVTTTITRLSIGTTTSPYLFTLAGTGNAVFEQTGNVTFQPIGQVQITPTATTTIGASTSTPIVLTGYVRSNIYPYADDTWDLGSTAYRWQDIYAVAGHFGGTIDITTDKIDATGVLTIESGGDLTATSTGAQIFATAGQERMRLLSTGEIGVGTSTPTGIFEIATSTGASVLYVADNGYVGIGTASPSYLLHVYKDQNASTALLVENTAAGTAANVAFHAQADSGTASLQVFSSSYTTSGAFMPDAASLHANSALSGGLSIGAFAGTGVIRFYTGGYAESNERMRITSSGNVSIATTSPQYKLHVWGSAGFGTSTTPTLYVDSGNGRVGIGTTEPDTPLHIVGILNLQQASSYDSNAQLWAGTWGAVGDSMLDFKTQTGGGNPTTEMRLFPGGGLAIGDSYINTDPGNDNLIIEGNVGIGTTSPDTVLHIEDDMTSPFTGQSAAVIKLRDTLFGESAIGAAFFEHDSSGSLNIGISRNDNATGAGIKFWTSPSSGASLTPVMFIQRTGNVGIGTVSPASLLELSKSDASPILTITNASTTADYDPTLALRKGTSDKWKIYLDDSDSDKLKIATGTANVLTITESGRVGIGTTSLISQTYDVDQGANKPIKLDLSGGGVHIASDGGLYIGDETTANAGGAHFAYNATLNKIYIAGIKQGVGYPDIVFRKGNVGIGTTTPLDILHVYQGDDTSWSGRGVFSGLSRAAVIGSLSGWPVVGAHNAALSSWSVLYVNVSPTNMASGGDVIMKGNVGIGTTTPQYTLDVNGNIRAATSVTAGINVESLSGSKTLTPGTDEMYQYLDPDINRVITLATTTAKAGDRFIIRHNGAYNESYYLQINQGTTILDYIYAQSVREYIFDGTNWVAGDVGTRISSDYNVAIGYSANSATSGTAVGREAQGYSYGTAVGDDARGYEEGAAVGYNTQGYSSGAAVGAYADGSDSGAAVGRSAAGFTSGAAVGREALGFSYGVAVGYYAKGMRYGAALGYEAGYNINAAEDRYNTLIGAYSGYQITTGKGNIVLGYKSGYDSTYSPTTGSY
ncbi:hypothetical protein J7K42_02980, partial [bacterium]|nr:hypothetical protein [bacterium]